MGLTVKVRCLNKHHSIHLSDKGRLRLCDHEGKEGIETAQAMTALGGGEARCLRVFELWKKKTLTLAEVKELPVNLYRVWKARRYEEFRYFKHKLRKGAFLDHSTVPYPDKLKDKSLSFDRKCYALNLIEAELLNRGYTVESVYQPFSPQTELYQAEEIRINRVSGIHVRVDIREYRKHIAVILSWLHYSESDIAATTGVPVNFIVDMVELTRFRSLSLRSPNLDSSAITSAVLSKFAKLETNFVTRYPYNQPQFNVVFKCKDKSSAVMLIHDLNKLTEKYKKSGRARTVKVR